MRYIILLTLLAVAVSVVVRSDVRAGGSIYPCNICTVLESHLVRFQPDDCGAHWRQRIKGVPHFVTVVCEKQNGGAWLVYLWACPICKE